MKRTSAILVPVLALVAGCAPYDADTVSVTGQIEAVDVGLGSRIGGRVSETLVEEGDAVKKGDVLVRLETNEASAGLAAAEAKLAQADALLAKLEAGARPEEIRQAEAAATRAEEQYRMAQRGLRSQEVQAAAAAADAARAQRDLARAEYLRIEKLSQTNVVSKERYDQAKHAFEAAESQYEAAREKQDMAAEGARTEEIAMAKAGFEQAAAALDLLRNGARQEDLAAARAAKAAAEADVSRAQVALDEMTVISPRDGVVESIDIHPGDLVKAGPVAKIVDPEDLELVVYVSALMLGKLKVGQKIPLTTDAHGDERFEAEILRIATEGEFTPRNLQTREERVQQVFGVKLKLNSAGGKLRAGMTAIAHFPNGAGEAK